MEERPVFFEAFVKSAQYIARLKTEQDIWEHLGKFMMTYFPVDWTAFIRKDPAGGISIHHCTLPEVTDFIMGDEIRTLVADVQGSGFLASRIILSPAPSMTVFLPIAEEPGSEMVMLIGHKTAEPVQKELLDIYLAIAGLAGTTCERLRNERELKRHHAHLEDLVKERTAELAETKRQNELILQSVGEGICGIDLGGRITFVNAAAAQLLGWEPSELIGRSSHGTFHHRRPDGCGYPLEECVVYSALRDGTNKSAMNEEFVRKDGTGFPVEFVITPLIEKGTILGAVMVFRDITKRKEAEDEIRRLNESLGQRAAELETSNRELEIANKELEAFCYSVSHEFRSPLRGIDGFSQAMLEDYADRIDEEGKKWLTEIRRASQKMARLIDDILMLSGVVRSELRIRKINLSDMARSIAERLKEDPPGRQVEFSIMADMEVSADPDLMRLALENLLGNAFKFSANHRPARIEFSASQSPRGKVYLIRDNGAGFDMKYVEKLFKPFNRLHSAREYPGTGIGLATVHRVIRRHGGNIWAEGEAGKGATFYFTLEEKGNEI